MSSGQCNSTFFHGCCDVMAVIRIYFDSSIRSIRSIDQEFVSIKGVAIIYIAGISYRNAKESSFKVYLTHALVLPK